MVTDRSAGKKWGASQGAAGTTEERERLEGGTLGTRAGSWGKCGVDRVALGGTGK